MIELIVALLSGMLLASLIAFVTFPKGAQVPMQWTFQGTPTWTLPKMAAVLFTPCLAVMVSGVIVLTAGNSERASAVLPLITGSFLFAHVLHLVLVKWHFSAKKS